MTEQERQLTEAVIDLAQADADIGANIDIGEARGTRAFIYNHALGSGKWVATAEELRAIDWADVKRERSEQLRQQLAELNGGDA